MILRVGRGEIPFWLDNLPVEGTVDWLSVERSVSLIFTMNRISLPTLLLFVLLTWSAQVRHLGLWYSIIKCIQFNNLIRERKVAEQILSKLGVYGKTSMR